VIKCPKVELDPHFTPLLNAIDDRMFIYNADIVLKIGCSRPVGNANANANEARIYDVKDNCISSVFLIIIRTLRFYNLVVALEVLQTRTEYDYDYDYDYE